MKVEKKKWWVAAFSVAGVAILGLIIAIIIVVINRGGGDVAVPGQVENTAEYTASEEEAVNAYNTYAAEIANRLFNENVQDTKTILEMYKEKIDASSDKVLRALLLSDYYNIMVADNPSQDLKDEVLNGMIEVDNVLQTVGTATQVSEMALYYGDNELAEKYSAIADERLAPGDTDTGAQETAG